MDEGKKEVSEAGGEEVVGGQIEGVPPKIATGPRIAAGLIDFGVVLAISFAGGVVAFFISFVSGFLASLVSLVAMGLGATYMGLRDSLMEGRSVGKKIMKLTVQTPEGTPCTPQQSLNRNAVLALPAALTTAAGLIGLVPWVGWIGYGLLILIAGVASLGALYEAVQVLALDPNGRRLMELESQTYTVLE